MTTVDQRPIPANTCKLLPERRKSTILSTLSVLGGVFIALQLLLPSIAFASRSTHPVASGDPPKSLARAGVSVVRLVLTYNITTASTGLTPTVQNTTPGSVGGQTLVASGRCTILGVLIRSWTYVAGEATNNNWVLTDGAMLNFNPSTCGPSATMTLPASIGVFASSAYTATNSNPQLLLLGSLNNPVVSDFRCANPSACSTGVVLFSFNTDTAHTQPYIALSPAPIDQAQAQRIGLMNRSATTPLKIADEQQIRPFLVPTVISASGSNEAGTPLVDENGDLVGMHLFNTSTPATLAEIGDLVNKQGELKPTGAHKNLLYDNWNAGIDKYYATRSDYPGAQQAFQVAEKLNPDFKAGSPTIFQHLPPPAPTVGTNPNATPTAQTTNSGTFLNSGIPNWLLSIGGLVVLTIFIILFSQTIARRGAQRRKERAQERAGFKADRQAADRKAAEDLQRQQQMPPSPASQPAPEQPAVQRPADVGQVQRPQAAQPAQQQQTLPVSPVTQDAAVANKPNPTTQRSIAEQRCPNCGQLTRVGATYCPNCRLVLSPSLPSVSNQSLPITTPPSPVPEPASQREKVPALSGPQSLAQQAPIQAPVIGTKETDSAKAIQATLRRLWSQAER
jgi:hypothetical protein